MPQAPAVEVDYWQSYRWQKEGTMWGDPPLLYPTAAEYATRETRAGNLAAALLQMAVVSIGGLPVKDLRRNDLLDADLARLLGDATDVPAATLRMGFTRLRADNFRLIQKWRYGDEDGVKSGLDEIWPVPDHDERARNDT